MTLPTMLEQTVAFLQPYDFSPTVLLVCIGAGLLYQRGWRKAGGGLGQAVMFWIGLVAMYVVLQTQFDYYGQHSFFMHRLQHLVLHHVAPFLIAVSAPAAILGAGLPERIHRYVVAPLRRNWLLRHLYAAIQEPLVAGAIFVGLIYFWLIPSVHFYAMLNVPLYNTMNWGMAIDGLLFWWMIFNLRAPGASDMRHYGYRLLVLFLVMFPQIALGAYIALSDHDLFGIYAACGRILPITPLTDQAIGGLLTWVPAAMMSVVGGLVLVHRWNRRSRHVEKPVSPTLGCAR
ncbi:cytochrome c oxidase assembly protein [Guyparkeria sp.]|uniref:cytochrome c oxidase assembly protein n=1 Tax=Guyparkeria sp. TaxID=2035736 RepID=UPI003561CDBF